MSAVRIVAIYADEPDTATAAWSPSSEREVPGQGPRQASRRPRRLTPTGGPIRFLPSRAAAVLQFSELRGTSSAENFYHADAPGTFLAFRPGTLIRGRTQVK